jgi:WD40 repeat protein
MESQKLDERKHAEMLKHLLELQKRKLPRGLDGTADPNLDPLQQTAKATSPDGKRLVTSRGGGIDLFDVESGRQIARSRGHNEAVTAVTFSPDGKLIASGSKDKSVVLWDTATLKEIRKFMLTRPVSSVRFSRDGRIIIISLSDQTRRRFDLATGKQLSADNERESESRP